MPSFPTSVIRARKLATLLDGAVTIPGIKQKIGLDPIIGAIPGFGDIVALLLGAYPVYVAYDLGLPWKIIGRMVLNIAIDMGISLVPVGGDIIDIFWRSNLRNVELLEKAFLEYGPSEPMYEASPEDEVIDVQAVTN